MNNEVGSIWKAAVQEVLSDVQSGTNVLDTSSLMLDTECQVNATLCM